MVERPIFLIDKNQSYTESNYCENKETLPDNFTRGFEIEYLPINTMDSIIDIKGHSDVMKLFRVTALVIRFVKSF